MLLSLAALDSSSSLEELPPPAFFPLPLPFLPAAAPAAALGFFFLGAALEALLPSEPEPLPSCRDGGGTRHAMQNGSALHKHTRPNVKG